MAHLSEEELGRYFDSDSLFQSLPHGAGGAIPPTGAGSPIPENSEVRITPARNVMEKSQVRMERKEAPQKTVKELNGVAVVRGNVYEGRMPARGFCRRYPIERPGQELTEREGC